MNNIILILLLSIIDFGIFGSYESCSSINNKYFLPRGESCQIITQEIPNDEFLKEVNFDVKKAMEKRGFNAK